MGRVSRNGVCTERQGGERKVAPRMGRVSRNVVRAGFHTKIPVAPRMGRVSRNLNTLFLINQSQQVAPRMGRMSRNVIELIRQFYTEVAPRMGRVSRNFHTESRFFRRFTSRPAWGV